MSKFLSFEIIFYIFNIFTFQVQKSSLPILQNPSDTTRENPNTPPERAPSQENQEGESDDELLRYGAKSVLMLIVPVSVCLLVVVTTVGSVTYYTQNQGNYL